MDEPQQIGFTAAESTPRFPHDPKPPRGRPQRGRDRPRRHRLRPPGCLRLRHRDAAPGHAGRRGCTLQPIPRHLALLADQGLVLHRAQPPRRRAWASWPTSRWLSPATRARLPKSAATLPRLLRDAGYSTLAVGKWHLTPRWQRSAAGPFDTWPLGLGFERYYGFLQGDTNHWTPNLVCDNHYIDAAPPPRGGLPPERGPGRPGRPHGAGPAAGGARASPSSCTSHSAPCTRPHHVAPEWVDPYRGVFDKGWDAWRDEVFARQVADGVVPEGTVLTPRPEWVQAWSDLSADERRMHARQQEVFAGFLTHTDAQIGRVPLLARESRRDGQHARHGLLRQRRQRGGRRQQGSFNEHRFTAHVRESLDREPRPLRRLGRLQHLQPLLVGVGLGRQHPAQALEALHVAGRDAHTADRALGRARRAARHRCAAQFAHAIDLMPTIMAAAGLDVPEAVDGVAQQPVDGVSLLAALEDPGGARAAPRPSTSR